VGPENSFLIVVFSRLLAVSVDLGSTAWRANAMKKALVFVALLFAVVSLWVVLVGLPNSAGFLTGAIAASSKPPSRLDVLEGKVAVLEANCASVQDQLAVVQNTLASTQQALVNLEAKVDKVVFWAKQLLAVFYVPCDGVPGEWRQGEAPFSELSDAAIQGATLSEGRLLFETARQANLLLEIQFKGVPQGQLCLQIDGNDVYWLDNAACSCPSGAPPPPPEVMKRVVMDVPAGPHVLSMRGAIGCGNTVASILSYLEVKYLE
jgi:hypothetical protein